MGRGIGVRLRRAAAAAAVSSVEITCFIRAICVCDMLRRRIPMPISAAANAGSPPASPQIQTGFFAALNADMMLRIARNMAGW